MGGLVVEILVGGGRFGEIGMEGGRSRNEIEVGVGGVVHKPVLLPREWGGRWTGGGWVELLFGWAHCACWSAGGVNAGGGSVQLGVGGKLQDIACACCACCAAPVVSQAGGAPPTV